MSTFFKDDKYEDMDFLTKAVRPILWSDHEKFVQFPDEIELEFAYISRYFNSSLDLKTLLKLKGKEYFNNPESFTNTENWFKIDISDGTYIDLLDNEIVGSIKLTKKLEVVKDSDILEIMGKIWEEKLPWNFRDKGVSGRIREVLDLLGVDVKSNGKKNTIAQFKRAMRELIADNKLKIFNGDLMINMMDWILGYICDNEPRCMANFAKLKVMTHKGEPIYSMKEISV